MTEKAMERQEITPVAQELNGKRVPQRVRMQLCHLGSLPEMVKELIQAAWRQRMAFSGEKQWLNCSRLCPTCQILPEYPPRGLPQIGDPILCPFAQLHDHLPVATA
jgi:hypothetical protein